uniref:Uncharacterized protein n=1 Tax=Solanum tuberosum TaxID=4113 RepID=M1DMD4_SOLTU
MHRLQDLRMGFIFQDPSECNLSVVQEFYPNWKPDGHSHFVTVRGVESTAKWIRHGNWVYHQSYPYAHMNREAQEQLDEIATRYPLNEHADALLGLGPAFLEPVWDDIPTDEDKRRTMSNSESDSDA